VQRIPIRLRNFDERCQFDVTCLPKSESHWDAARLPLPRPWVQNGNRQNGKRQTRPLLSACPQPHLIHSSIRALVIHSTLDIKFVIPHSYFVIFRRFIFNPFRVVGKFGSPFPPGYHPGLLMLNPIGFCFACCRTGQQLSCAASPWLSCPFIQAFIHSTLNSSFRIRHSSLIRHSAFVLRNFPSFHIQPFQGCRKIWIAFSPGLPPGATHVEPYRVLLCLLSNRATAIVRSEPLTLLSIYSGIHSFDIKFVIRHSSFVTHSSFRIRTS